MSTSKFGPSDNPAPIFVFACCQRSGSTLLQRLLNSHPQVLIWGEHGGYISHLYDGYLSLASWKDMHATSANAFLSDAHKIFMPNAIADRLDIDSSFREHVRRLFPVPLELRETCVWGFKEVRYTIWTAKFLESLFPAARFIHLVRNVDDCLTSMRRLELQNLWQPDWTADALSNWVRVNRSFADFSHLLSNYLLVRYEDLIGSGSKYTIAELERFLELKANSVNQLLLRTHVDLAPRRKVANKLTEEDSAFLALPEVQELKERFHY